MSEPAPPEVIARIQARRAQLAAQLAEAQQQYAELEQTLAGLDRQLCAMHGGLQELDALLAEAAPVADHAGNGLSRALRQRLAANE
jgi:chaperonin cofactor prefoldin